VKKEICEDHFIETDFVNQEHRRLIYSAVPQNYFIDNSFSSPPKQNAQGNLGGLSTVDSTMKRANKCLSVLLHEANTPRKKKLASYVNKYATKIKKLKQKLQGCRKKLFTMNTKNNAADMHVICKMQKHGQRQKWAPEDKQFALGVFYNSPSTYKYLLREGLNLPGVRSIRRWIGKIELRPGFSDHVFLKLKKLTENWSTAKRLTVLLFDEMSIKKGLDYNKSNDCIEGFEASLSL
jgi:hypothetical protein